jgi:tetratricopeptide (TPR) repeat protein
VEWMQQKQGLVLGVIGLIVAAGIGFGVYTYVQNNANEAASTALAAALDVYEAPLVDDTGTSDPSDKTPKYKTADERTKASRELFQKAGSAHKGTGAAAVAQLYVGHTSLKLGEYDAAIAAYEAFLKDTAKTDPLRFAGYSGLASALDAKGDRKAAIAKLEDLVALPEKIDEDAALLELGRLHIAEGNTDAARKALERIAKDFPESALKSRADELIATMPSSGAPPAPGTPPAPPAPAPTTPPAPAPAP